jgi:hypothetical protein
VAQSSKKKMPEKKPGIFNRHFSEYPPEQKFKFTVQQRHLSFFIFQLCTTAHVVVSFHICTCHVHGEELLSNFCSNNVQICFKKLKKYRCSEIYYVKQKTCYKQTAILHLMHSIATEMWTHNMKHCTALFYKKRK